MLTVSNYHYIRENFTTPYPSIFGLTPHLFKRQLFSLKGLGTFINPKDLLLNADEILKSQQNYILVTFDDGLKEQYNNALPILEELNIPAIFFINTINHSEKKVSLVHKIHLLRSIISSEDLLEKINQTSVIVFSDEQKKTAHQTYRFDNKKIAELKYLLNFLMSISEQELVINNLFEKHFEEKEAIENLYMDKTDLMSLAEKGYLGSHTHSHYPIGLLTSKAMEFELKYSKQYLEELTKTKVEIVSYPYGTAASITTKVIEIAKKVGYKIGFSTKAGINSINQEKLLLNRFDCNDLIGGKNYKL